MFGNYTKKPILFVVLLLLGIALASNNALAERILVIGGDTGNQATNDIIANQVSGLTGTVDRAEWLVYREWNSEYIINNYDVIVLSHTINESLFAIDWRTRLKPFLHSGKAIIWEAPMNLSTDIRADYGIDVRGAFYVNGGIPTTGLNVLPGADPVLINSLTGEFSGVDGMFLAWDNSLLTPYVNTFYAGTGETFTYALYGEFGGGRIVITGTADDDAGLSTGTAAQRNHYQHLVNKLLWVGGRTGIPDPNAVVIPDWSGLTEADAIAAVNNLLGKSPDFISTSVSNLYPSGTVSHQQPYPGDAAMANDPDPVFVSLSVVAQRTGDPVTVPNVTGMTSYAEVDDALDAADGVLDGWGLYRNCCPSAYNPTVPAGTIITQYPKAGAQSTTDWVVDVVMSNGPNPGVVPGLMWMAQAEAESTVVAAGYVVGQIIMQNNEAIEAGIVLGQIPEQNGTRAAGSNVDIIVSAGPVGTELIAVP
ncbi:MAG: PASTA domain-containing protein, partial [Gammaproteobacteria bacterium]